MLSKISIDVDDQGLSTISISLPKSSYVLSDVRDKLVQRFLEGGMFGLITRVGDNNDAEIHSMNALDLLANMLTVYGHLFKDSDRYEEFEQAVYKLAHKIESASGEKSTAFLKKVEAQELVYGCAAPHDYKDRSDEKLK